jgi:hypothetical protein
MPTRRHVAPLRRSAWLHLAALWLAWGTLAAQAPNRSESDSLDSLLRTAEAHHFRGALGEAHAALAAADSMAKRRSEPAALARVWVTWAGVWISQTTATTRDTSRLIADATDPGAGRSTSSAGQIRSLPRSATSRGSSGLARNNRG